MFGFFNHLLCLINEQLSKTKPHGFISLYSMEALFFLGVQTMEVVIIRISFGFLLFLDNLITKDFHMNTPRESLLGYCRLKW